MRLVIHKSGQGYVKEQTVCTSCIGTFLLEFDLSLSVGRNKMKTLFIWLILEKTSYLMIMVTEILHDSLYFGGNVILPSCRLAVLPL